MTLESNVTREQIALIEEYYRLKQGFIDLQDAQAEDTELADSRAGVQSEEKGETETSPTSLPTRDSKMPAQAKEEETQTSNITDKVAKESDDSTASSHELHSNAHSANLGPVKAKDLPEPTSKEDNKKRAEELNK